MEREEQRIGHRRGDREHDVNVGVGRGKKKPANNGSGRGKAKKSSMGLGPDDEEFADPLDTFMASSGMPPSRSRKSSVGASRGQQVIFVRLNIIEI